MVVLLAAEHRDDVVSTSLYYEVNVEGARNVVQVMREHDIRRLIFTSTVAVYGLNRESPKETDEVNPFGDYGQSKWEAEEVLRGWWQDAPDERELVIVRPCVVFGEKNRGNVYNLLKQIHSGHFLMIGSWAELQVHGLRWKCGGVPQAPARSSKSRVSALQLCRQTRFQHE